MDSSGERHAGLLAADDLRDGRRRTRCRSRSTTTASTCSRRARGARRPSSSSSCGCSRASTSQAWASERGVRPHDHRVREARVRRSRGVVRRSRVLRRADGRRCSRASTRTSGARSSATSRRPSCVRARPTAEPRLATPAGGAPLAPGVGEPTRGDTVHLDVVDRWGNMVAATPSGGWLWGAPVIPELGFCLGTRAQMFWLEEGLPNSLEPGKRPRTTLSPTLVGRGGEPYLALGTPGGDQQDQWTLQVLLGHLHFGLDLQAAIDAPNHHTEAFPSSFYPRETRRRHVAVEERAGEETIDGLRDARPRRRGLGPGARPGERGRPRSRRAAEGGREPARHAGLRGRTLRIEPTRPRVGHRGCRVGETTVDGGDSARSRSGTARSSCASGRRMRARSRSTWPAGAHELSLRGDGVYEARIPGRGGRRVSAHRRRPGVASRSVLARPAARCARPVRGRGHGRIRVDGRRLAGRLARRPGRLRAPRRHVRGGRDIRCGRSAAARAARARRNGDRTDAGCDVPRRARLGLRRPLHLCAAPCLRRSRADWRASSTRRMPRARRAARRRLQPCRSRQRSAARVRPVLHEQARDVLG